MLKSVPSFKSASKYDLEVSANAQLLKKEPAIVNKFTLLMQQAIAILHEKIYDRWMKCCNQKEDIATVDLCNPYWLNSKITYQLIILPPEPCRDDGHYYRLLLLAFNPSVKSDISLKEYSTIFSIEFFFLI